MRRLALVLPLVLGLASPRAASADTLPSKKEALAAATSWRTAVNAVPCDRPVANGPFVCSGAGLQATMPAPVSFGMTGNASSNVVCENDDGYTRWEGKRGLHVIEAGADYDQLAGCLEGMFEINPDARPSVKGFSAVSKFLSKAARKQLKPLAKTHRFVRLVLQPSGPDDPYNHYDVILAVTLGDDGTAKVTAVAAHLVQGDPGGE